MTNKTIKLEKEFDTKCKHKWIKKEYIGYGVIATWEVCLKCHSEKNRALREK
jgi:hypothetical protein